MIGSQPLSPRDSLAWAQVQKELLVLPTSDSLIKGKDSVKAGRTVTLTTNTAWEDSACSWTSRCFSSLEALRHRSRHSDGTGVVHSGPISPNAVLSVVLTAGPGANGLEFTSDLL